VLGCHGSRGTISTAAAEWSIRLKLMMNNLTEDEKSEATQPETVVAPEPQPATVEDEQSVEITENASPDILTRPNEADHVIALLTSLSDELRETNRISQERESIIDRLHRENQQLKQGELQQALLPIFRDLIRLYDDLKSTAASYAKHATTESEKVVKDWNCYRDTVTDILYRHGVEQIEADIGEDFNSKEHKAVAAIHVADLAQDRKISKIVRDGFRTENKIIRNVEVEVFRCSAPEIETGGAERREVEVDK
jgi:molecular chaperone GrpE (heat shock protein)